MSSPEASGLSGPALGDPPTAAPAAVARGPAAPKWEVVRPIWTSASGGLFSILWLDRNAKPKTAIRFGAQILKRRHTQAKFLAAKSKVRTKPVGRSKARTGWEKAGSRAEDDHPPKVQPVR